MFFSGRWIHCNSFLFCLTPYFNCRIFCVLWILVFQIDLNSNWILEEFFGVTILMLFDILIFNPFVFRIYYNYLFFKPFEVPQIIHSIWGPFVSVDQSQGRNAIVSMKLWIAICRGDHFHWILLIWFFPSAFCGVWED
jgi:hypothetical protein